MLLQDADGTQKHNIVSEYSSVTEHSMYSHVQLCYREHDVLTNATVTELWVYSQAVLPCYRE